MRCAQMSHPPAERGAPGAAKGDAAASKAQSVASSESPEFQQMRMVVYSLQNSVNIMKGQVEAKVDKEDFKQLLVSAQRQRRDAALWADEMPRRNQLHRASVAQMPCRALPRRRLALLRSALVRGATVCACACVRAPQGMGQGDLLPSEFGVRLDSLERSSKLTDGLLVEVQAKAELSAQGVETNLSTLRKLRARVEEYVCPHLSVCITPLPLHMCASLIGMRLVGGQVRSLASSQ